jgi:hypothetical protein
VTPGTDEMAALEDIQFVCRILGRKTGVHFPENALISERVQNQAEREQSAQSQPE